MWKENEKRWNQKLMHQTGVLWMVTAGDDHFERLAITARSDVDGSAVGGRGGGEHDHARHPSPLSNASHSGPMFSMS